MLACLLKTNCSPLLARRVGAEYDPGGCSERGLDDVFWCDKPTDTPACGSKRLY